MVPVVPFMSEALNIKRETLALSQK